MRDDLCTHKDLARLLGVSETTIKNYRKKFPEFLRPHTQGKPLRFEPRAAEVCTRIRECFLLGLGVEETRTKLHAQFPDGPHDPAAPPPPGAAGTPGPGQPPELAGALDGIARALERMADIQAQTLERLDTLHTLAEATSPHDPALASVLREIKDALAQLAQAPAAQPAAGAPSAIPPTAKRITVKNAYGETSEYLMHTRPAEPEPPTPQNPAPPQTPAEPELPEPFHSLPLVIQSRDGAFLGVAGKQLPQFSLTTLRELMTRVFPPPRHFTFQWEQTDSDLRYIATQHTGPDAQRYELDIQHTTTPRGNNVALITQLTVNKTPTPTAYLYTFIRQMKDLERRSQGHG